MTVPFRKQFYCHPGRRLHPLHQPDPARPPTIISYRPKFHKVLRRYRLRGFSCGTSSDLDPRPIGPLLSIQDGFRIQNKAFPHLQTARFPAVDGCRTAPKFSRGSYANPSCVEDHSTQVKSPVIPQPASSLCFPPSQPASRTIISFILSSFCARWQWDPFSITAPTATPI